ncbi:DUF1178 family protein [Altericroceibacterium spongiae]|uniref:DUF1178 family protein n=1 Tax=Altericroceibacterium spongiae TaxID=2320269 RepID=A0A420ERI4_9SPHN|nr:DUF1178 family protein [Altericroceibacterium spongiae]RKF23304.1 DUF1178 family protein [Altericroceibacterium spongiae]
MIVFDLVCSSGHRFEGWFGSSQDYASQQERELLSCPQCGSAQIEKAPMAPAVPRKGNQQSHPIPREHAPGDETKHAEKEGDALHGPSQDVTAGEMPPQVAQALEKLAQVQAEALKESTWVGSRFSEEARAMHYGEKKSDAIHGRASAEETRELLEEGITVSPLLFPISPPDEMN